MSLLTSHSALAALVRILVTATVVTAAACSTPPPSSEIPAKAPPDDPMTNPSTPETKRPELRRILVAHPDTVARQVPADNPEHVAAYLAAHTDLPDQIVRGIQGHEIWLGMNDTEVTLSVGPSTRKEAVPDRPGAYALFYAGEGWLLRFGEDGYLYELVER
jgi:hypothetical protein